MAEIVDVVAESYDQGSGDLARIRESVDRVDALLVTLVAGRTALTVNAAGIKARLGIDTFVPGRHAQVVENYIDAVPKGSDVTGEDAAGLSEVVQGISRGAQDRWRADFYAAADAGEAGSEGGAEQAREALSRPSLETILQTLSDVTAQAAMDLTPGAVET